MFDGDTNNKKVTNMKDYLNHRGSKRINRQIVSDEKLFFTEQSNNAKI